MNFWDNISALAGEVNKPGKTFPVALLVVVALTCLSYLIPLFAVIGAVDVPQLEWGSGFHATMAEMIARKLLKILLGIGAGLSAIGLYEAQLSSCAYHILGPLHKFFAARSNSRTSSPTNFIYSLSMLLEFAAFLWLRHKMPELQIPYRIPMRLSLLCVFCLIPESSHVAAPVSAAFSSGFPLLCRRRGALSSRFNSKRTNLSRGGSVRIGRAASH
ncbi:unnamed protein product [Linum tenue]|uniref:Uncharacterized protein n=1 Tax=Linum tenue TaxID=586396 RepID=A0AAV0MAZ2_9ROSI|nr:unnamed protein product [Linum tenue]